ncbi:MAG: hypothetical protein QOE70_4397 [Chthoniobacter sp.]|jgi:hypothetical protein|nr:hypothetical protein [Chthoniobacter sp.]
MRALAWLLCRYTGTIALARLERATQAELLLRACLALDSHTASPHQRPPAELLLVIALLAAAGFLAACQNVPF